jgi:ribosomal protein L40E
MGKIFFGLAIFCLGIGLLDASGASPGSHRELEGGILLLLTPLFAIAGFAMSRASSKICQHCAERIKKQASKCKHCGESVN